MSPDAPSPSRVRAPLHRSLALLRCLGACALVGLAGPASADLRWHYADEFDAAERERLEGWITEVVAHIEDFVAPFPFTVEVHFHRTDNARSPVPWAHTIRGRGQGVSLHVDPAYSDAALRSDWTAWHEVSHLLLPYLGRRHAWFAEGFASYMQYRAMQSAGLLTGHEANARYASRIRRAAANYDLAELTFVEAAPVLRSRREFPVMYWGGAVYFLTVERDLQARGRTLPDVLRSFVRCGRMRSGERDELDALVATLDEIAGGDAFRRHLEVMRNEAGFPDATAILEAGSQP